MTSGQFKSIPIDSVSVDRATRQRRRLDGIEDLADSIRRVGLINPPVIRQDGTLVAGERRLSACQSLGWTSIPVQYIEDLPEHEARLIELEENIRRVDLDWRDQCRAMKEYHDLRAATTEGWTITDTGNAIGMSKAPLSKHISVAKELAKGNTRVEEAPKFSVAYGIVERQNNRRNASTLQDAVAKPILSTDEPAAPEPDLAPILNADFLEWAPSYDGQKFNFIHCDFPYGINADQHDQGNAAARGGYVDDRDLYFSLIQTLTSNLDNFCTPAAHIMFWFSMEYYNETLSALESAGFTILRHPLLWHKSDNSGILPDPRRQPRRVYETAFMGARGDRFLVGPVSNLVAAPNTKTIHMSEKPQPVLRHFFRMFVDDTARVLDPTCGSGNALKVADEMGAEKMLGLELDADMVEQAKEAWNDEN